MDDVIRERFIRGEIIGEGVLWMTLSERGLLDIGERVFG